MSVLKQAITATAVVVAVCAHGAAAQNAKPKVGAVFGDWTYACTAFAEGETTCAITQTLVTGEPRRPIARFNIGVDPQTEVLTLTALVPLGLAFSDGLSATIDTQSPFTIPLETCIQGGCIGKIALTGRIVDDFAAGTTITLNYRLAANNAPIGIPGSLQGVAEAFQATGWR